MCGRIKKVNLLRFHAGYGIRIHLYQYFRVGMASADSCAGDVMCLFCQVLCHKDLIACFHDSGIVYVYVLHEEPGTNTMICQSASLFHKLHHVIIQQQAGLIL